MVNKVNSAEKRPFEGVFIAGNPGLPLMTTGFFDPEGRNEKQHERRFSPW
jgi:hypothetical protein